MGCDWSERLLLGEGASLTDSIRSDGRGVRVWVV
jgi:hypothetical protein